MEGFIFHHYHKFVCFDVPILATLEATYSSINSSTLYALVFRLVEKVVALAKTYWQADKSCCLYVSAKGYKSTNTCCTASEAFTTIKRVISLQLSRRAEVSWGFAALKEQPGWVVVNIQKEQSLLELPGNEQLFIHTSTSRIELNAISAIKSHLLTLSPLSFLPAEGTAEEKAVQVEVCH